MTSSSGPCTAISSPGRACAEHGRGPEAGAAWPTPVDREVGRPDRRIELAAGRRQPGRPGESPGEVAKRLAPPAADVGKPDRASARQAPGSGHRLDHPQARRVVGDPGKDLPAGRPRRDDEARHPEPGADGEALAGGVTRLVDSGDERPGTGPGPASAGRHGRRTRRSRRS